MYDLSENQGWVSVGIDHDTARFAAEAIRRWWKKMGAKRYRDARELLITADGGGSNGSRCRLWKVALQELAIKLGMPIHVRHFPPGTDKLCAKPFALTLIPILSLRNIGDGLVCEPYRPRQDVLSGVDLSNCALTSDHGRAVSRSRS